MIGRPSRSGDGSAHDDVPSLPIRRLEHDSAQSGPRDGGGPHRVVNGAFEGTGGGTNLTVKKGVGGERREDSAQGEAELSVMCYDMWCFWGGR
jgi:hypothetical protein